MSNLLNLTRYWNIPPTPKIGSISKRLHAVYHDLDPGPVEVDEAIDIDEAFRQVEHRKRRTKLPFQQQLEEEFKRDLSWLNIRKGESEAMRLIQEDWLVVGNTMFFGDEQPSYQQVKSAVKQVISKKKVSG